MPNASRCGCLAALRNCCQVGTCVQKPSLCCRTFRRSRRVSSSSNSGSPTNLGRCCAADSACGWGQAGRRGVIGQVFRSPGASSPGGGLRHNIQRAYEVLRRRCRAPTAYGLCSPKAILLFFFRSPKNPLRLSTFLHYPPPFFCVQAYGQYALKLKAQ